MHWAALYRHRTRSRQLTAESGKPAVWWWAGRASGTWQLLPLAHGRAVGTAPLREPPLCGAGPGVCTAASPIGPAAPAALHAISEGLFQSCSGEGDASAVQPTMARDHSNGARALWVDGTLRRAQPTTGARAHTCAASSVSPRRAVPAAGSPPPPHRTYCLPPPRTGTCMSPALVWRGLRHPLAPPLGWFALDSVRGCMHAQWLAQGPL